MFVYGTCMEGVSSVGDSQQSETKLDRRVYMFLAYATVYFFFFRLNVVEVTL